jgi:hypothetical protein
VDDDLRAFEHDFTYGALMHQPWLSPVAFDGHAALAPRRLEVLGDQTDAFWEDLVTWVVWAQHTFRLTRWFPPCWPKHPALVEELVALWGLWQAVWLPSTDASAPIGFLRDLDYSISRVERLWKPPCTVDAHKEQPETDLGADGTPGLHHWWSNPNYMRGARPWQ